MGHHSYRVIYIIVCRKKAMKKEPLFKGSMKYLLILFNHRQHFIKDPLAIILILIFDDAGNVDIEIREIVHDAVFDDADQLFFVAGNPADERFVNRPQDASTEKALGVEMVIDDRFIEQRKVEADAAVIRNQQCVTYQELLDRH